jgi:cobalt/nickel transport system permease protein
MHIPDGFINAPTSLAAGAAAAGGVGVSLRRAAQTLQERQAPLAGLVAAYLFAVQLLNFPVAAGISVVLASVGFVVEYAIGGTGAPVGAVFAAMVGVHTLIGIGEGIITTLTVGVVLGVRPDLVYGAADLQTPLVLGPKSGETAGEVR